MTDKNKDLLEKLFRRAYREGEAERVELSSAFAQRTAQRAMVEVRAYQPDYEQREILTFKTAFAMAMLAAMMVIPKLRVPSDAELAYSIDPIKTESLMFLEGDLYVDE